ncbi:MAG: HAMP domain-containing histidine kinase [Burkholderiales bacterium]|nr:HAMP domain-containing histidine kinase [Burkholderiales bacterium]
MLRADPSLEWLTRAQPLDVFAWVVGAVMLVIAAAQWVASRVDDRRALRIFSLRYAVAGLSWWFAHPGRLQAEQPVPTPALVVSIVLLGMTVWALDEFLGHANRRRRAFIALGTLAALVFGLVFRHWRPADPGALYWVMIVAMSTCAVLAWRAARAEPGVGHAVVALAFASYPVVMVTALLWLGWGARANLSYPVALPSVIVGITVLLVSLMRATRRARTELQRRELAEARLAELNTTLEHRVGERTAELQTLVDGLESFARSISHDLRGSLGGAATLSRMALGALVRGEHRDTERMLSVMAPQLEHMDALVRDLLTLTRLGDASIHRSEQPLAPLVQQALDQLALEPASAEALARTEVVVGELPRLAVDATLLRQVFVNLLSNALRFAASGPQPAKVSVGHAAPSPGAPPALYVADNGPGFAPDAAGKLFHPFARLHEGTLSNHGIGLSIVRRIVERHGGRVWAECRPGERTVFWFSLPAGAVPPAAPAVHAQRAEAVPA